MGPWCHMHMHLQRHAKLCFHQFAVFTSSSRFTRPICSFKHQNGGLGVPNKNVLFWWANKHRHTDLQHTVLKGQFIYYVIQIRLLLDMDLSTYSPASKKYCQ